MRSSTLANFISLWHISLSQEEITTGAEEINFNEKSLCFLAEYKYLTSWGGSSSNILDFFWAQPEAILAHEGLIFQKVARVMKKNITIEILKTSTKCSRDERQAGMCSAAAAALKYAPSNGICGCRVLIFPV